MQCARNASGYQYLNLLMAVMKRALSPLTVQNRLSAMEGCWAIIPDRMIILFGMQGDQPRY